MFALSLALLLMLLAVAWPLAAEESPPVTEPLPVRLAEPPSEGSGPTPAVVIPPEIAAAVAELQSKEFTVRQQAENRLLEMGAAAFEPVIALLDKVSVEVGQRALLILERIWLQTPEPQADVLEQQLEKISLSFGQYQPVVRQMLLNHHSLREERAARSLRRLNAIVQLAEDENDRELRANLDVDLNQSRLRVSTVILPRSWKGTSADLWHIRRFSHAEVLQVFVVRGIDVTEADKLAIRMGFPGLNLGERSEIFIGVEGKAIAIDDRPGCLVTGVQFDSPAQIAGIQESDRILAVDGVEIRNFEDLVEKLKLKSGYQPIEMTVERYSSEQPLMITVIGLPWEVRQFPKPPPPPMAESLTAPPTHRRGRFRMLPN